MICHGVRAPAAVTQTPTDAGCVARNGSEWVLCNPLLQSLQIPSAARTDRAARVRDFYDQLMVLGEKRQCGLSIDLRKLLRMLSAGPLRQTRHGFQDGLPQWDIDIKVHGY